MSAGAGIPAPSALARRSILAVVGVLFAIPLVAMVEFTLRRGLEGGYDLSRWITVLTGDLGPAYRPLGQAIGNSLALAAVTVLVVLVLLVPTMVLVQLRLPRLRRALEFVCLLPISIPAIVLVVGLAPVYSVVARLFGSGVWTLAFAYGIIVLPFAYRAVQSNLEALDLATLTEAARSLGASWPVVIVRVLLPNLRRGLLAAGFISIAVVLGEFTIASLLNRQNLQTALVVVSKDDPYIAVVLALLALLLAFVLLLAIGRVGRGRTRKES
ncbi:ABC transporter permease subunit [Microcella daejeonensis]|uniref:ABC transporter permease subunit n=1 Tax=Microcella daejeonensis TaxID=2994971 RepID=A0A9E8MPN5_9MICO|nr:ABC transporter permease subunit [Microcella daejeonensis]WAB82742.1 ABC transporter permease subunit [Microcella daejeonensis]